MASCYIIHSKKLNRFYVGATQSDILFRIDKHNNAFYGNNKFTNRAKDWSLFLKIDATDFKHALRMEKIIKSKKSAIFIRNLNKYPELLQSIFDQSQQPDV